MRPLLAIVSLSTAALFACSADMPPPADTSVRVGLPGDTKRAPIEGEADAGTDAGMKDGGADASQPTMDGGTPDVDTPPVSYDPAAICPAVIALGSGTLLPCSTPADDVGLAMTLDGLSAAWTTAASGVVTVHYVDRASTSEAFAPERTTTGAFAPGRVAVKHDGLGLAVVNQDGLGFSYLARATRTDAFGAPSVGPFEMLAVQGTDELAPAGERFGNPVFARDDTFLLYTRIGQASSITYVSTRFSSSQAFVGGAPFADAALGVSGQRRVVTGVSQDVRTLFVWDETAQKSRVVSLSASSQVAGDVELGAMRDVQPSADCKTFYFGSGAPADLFRFAIP
jgi:hypothetical protein